MRRKFIIALVVIASMALTAGVVKAASGAFDSLTVGKQGTGGVTYFNGTIVNDTTGAGTADNPVTFGDNVRIDGRIYRGATAGTADSLPLIVNDNMEVVGSLATDSLSTGALAATSLSGTGIVSTGNILDGTIATGDMADSAVNSAKISDSTVTTADIDSNAVTQGVESSLVTDVNTIKTEAEFDTLQSLSITTGASTVLCMWSGYGDTMNDNEFIWVQMLLDGTLIQRTVRIQRTAGGDNTNHTTMATQALFSVAAGTHTVSMEWNTETSANMYQATLDCIELKK
ncbi:MAG: hypothetical protein WC505_04095 [Patescibacteria group bacterium]